jgi:hypothetical protein
MRVFAPWVLICEAKAGRLEVGKRKGGLAALMVEIFHFELLVEARMWKYIWQGNKPAPDWLCCVVLACYDDGGR